MRKALIFALIGFLSVQGRAEAKLKKSMKKECLICHENWLLEAKIKSPRLLTKRSLKAEDRRMCLTCHDGSIADDRLTFLGFGRHSHPVDTKVPKDFKMPKGFPTKKGKLYCATCHTPHTKTGSEKKLDYTFMREPNVNSALCIKCHKENREKGRNHPILNDVKEAKLTDKEIRGIKELGGKLSANSEVICESCHSPHRGRAEKALVYYVKRSQLCVVCHEENLNSKEHPNSKTHPIHEKFPKGAKLSLFKKEKAITKSVECLTCHKTHREKNKHLTVLAQKKLCSSCHVDEAKVSRTDHDIEGKLCSSCHVAHRAKGPVLWARRISEKAYEYASLIGIKQSRDILCLTCHYGGMKVGKKKVEDIGLITHPTGKEVKVKVKLPLNRKKLMRCATCHNPHYAYNGKKEGNFLREERLKLCYDCHRDKRELKSGKHAKIKKKLRKGDCKACHLVHKAKDFKLSAVMYSATSPNEPKIDGFCLACHDPNGMAEHKVRMTSNYEHPLGGKNRSAKLPGKRVGCATCHEAHLKEEELLRIPVRGSSKLCLECHEENSVKGTSHDVLNSKNAKLSVKERKRIEKGGPCSACHVPHNPKWKVLWSRKLGKGKTVNERMCSSCHVKGGMADKSTVGKITHPMGEEVKNVSLPMIDQFTGLPAKKGIKGVLDCATCHDPHNGADRKRLIRYTIEGDSYICVECHKAEGSIVATEHDMRVLNRSYRNALGEDVLKDGVCSACHVPHRAKGKFLWAFDTKKLDRNTVSNYCLNCHSKDGIGKKKVVKFYRHPSRDIVVRSAYRPGRMGKWPTFSKDGKKVKFGGDITCATCHDPHSWYSGSKRGPGRNVEGTVTNSFLRNRTVAGSICVDCHGIDALYRYKFFHDKRAHEEKPSYR